MSDIAAIGWLILVMLELFLLMFGVANLSSYRTTVPEKVQTFAALRTSDNEFRSIVAPAIAALVTGLLISLAASFAFEEIRTQDGTNILPSFWFFIGALVVLVLLLQPLMRGELPLEKFAQHPQRIFLAANAVRGSEDDAARRLDTLQASLSSWWDRRGAFAMGWVRKPQSAVLNEALGGVPAHVNLRFRDAARAVVGRGLLLAMLRTGPWRFGWPIYLLPIPPLLLALDALLRNEAWPAWWPLAAISLTAFGLLSLAVYWAGIIFVGVRRLAIGYSCLAPCQAAIQGARSRVAVDQEQRGSRGAISASLIAMSQDLNRIENTLRERGDAPVSLDLPRDRQEPERTVVMRRAWPAVIALLMFSMTWRFVSRRYGRR